VTSSIWKQIGTVKMSVCANATNTGNGTKLLLLQQIEDFKKKPHLSILFLLVVMKTLTEMQLWTSWSQEWPLVVLNGITAPEI